MCICSEPVPLVYVLGSTIWPQVLSIYLKPSVSVPLLIVSRVSSRLASPLIIQAVWRRRCLEKRERGERGGWRTESESKEPGKKTQNEWVTERENVHCLWTWPQLLVLLMNGEDREGKETPRQDCLCWGCEGESDSCLTGSLLELWRYKPPTPSQPPALALN